MFYLVQHNHKHGECAPILSTDDLRTLGDDFKKDPFVACACCHGDLSNVSFETFPTPSGDTYAMCYKCAMGENTRWGEL